MKKLLLILLFALPFFVEGQTLLRKEQIEPLVIDTTASDINRPAWEAYINRLTAGLTAPTLDQVTGNGNSLTNRFVPRYTTTGTKLVDSNIQDYNGYIGINYEAGPVPYRLTVGGDVWIQNAPSHANHATRLQDVQAMINDSLAGLYGGAGMVYPGAGIALSNGSGWATSITDNSANWNTAYGWGNHADAGYLTSVNDSLWSADANGISYSGGSVGIGAASASDKIFNAVSEDDSKWAGYFQNSTGRGVRILAGGSTEVTSEAFEVASVGGLSFTLYRNGFGEMQAVSSPPPAPEFAGFGRFWVDFTDGDKLKWITSTATYDLTSSGGTSLWSADIYGISYTAGNVGIGSASINGYNLNVDKSLAGWAARFRNNNASGHGIEIVTGNANASYYGLQVANSSQTIFQLNNSGQLRLHRYGSGLWTGTVAKYLAVTSTGQLIEATGGGGTVTSVGLSSTDLTVTGSPVTTSGTITANLANSAVQYNHINNNVISGKTALTSGLVSTDELMVSDAGTIKRMDLSVLEEYMNREQTLANNAPSMNYTTAPNAILTLTSPVSDFAILNVPVGGEGKIELTTNGNTFTIAGSTGYTNTVLMGERSAVSATGTTTVVYWRTGSTLKYGFIYEN